MNYWAELDFRLGILLKHCPREGFLMQHKLSCQFSMTAWYLPSFFVFYFPVNFRITQSASSLMQTGGNLQKEICRTEQFGVNCENTHVCAHVCARA